MAESAGPETIKVHHNNSILMLPEAAWAPIGSIKMDRICDNDFPPPAHHNPTSLPHVINGEHNYYEGMSS